ncbi:DUF11 domain-containing protein [Massilia forsythiae]|uniref:DUF11 domain-containing protein n=1 Tax=Massilia forsythiae TaxID=2728020 RepID=A0A7Z2ZU41_9BURK|nr:DUF11 domain-containing protein [Massilia forsythiae]QJE01915.1 DUF11 domain-containing protein [Massilia forsythiae]
MNRYLVIVIMVVLQLAATRVFAAANDVVVALHAFKVVAGAGGQKLVPTTEALPGDTIEYQVTYRNAGAGAARDVLATLPVPQGGMHYLPGSASPGEFQASLDGAHFAPAPLTRTVVRDGRRQVETVPPSEYRFLRWKLGELAPGRSVTVSSRMRLDDAPVTTNRS